MTLPGHPLRALAVAWSPDQKFLASGGTDSSIRIWDVATGKLVHEIKWFSEMTHRLSWNPVNNQLAAAGFSNFQAWDAATWKPLTKNISITLPALKWSPDGLRLAYSTLQHQGALTLRNHAIEPNGFENYHTALVYGIDWNQESTRMITAGEDGRIHHWDTQKMAHLDLILQVHERFSDIAFTDKKGTQAIAITREGSIYTIDLSANTYENVNFKNIIMTRIDWHPETDLIAISGVTRTPYAAGSLEAAADTGFLQINPASGNP